MATLTLGTDKTPVGTVQYLSDGDTIPWVALGSEVLGDVVLRNTADNRIGVVTGLASPDDSAATAGDIISIRVTGMVLGKKGTEATKDAHNDGDGLIWSVGAKQFEKHADGPHECVGGYLAADTVLRVRINALPNAALVATPSASPSPT
jgi:hypothetical protein